MNGRISVVFAKNFLTGPNKDKIPKDICKQIEDYLESLKANPNQDGHMTVLANTDIVPRPDIHEHALMSAVIARNAPRFIGDITPVLYNRHGPAKTLALGRPSQK